MQNTLSILLISILMEIFGTPTNMLISDVLPMNNKNEIVDTSLLDFYRQYSEFTDPGEYAYLYENLPDSLPELCRLIKSQIIHPFAELPGYREQIPPERWNEFFNYPTVKSIQEDLLS